MIILIAGLILIGPDKMPEIARTIGKAMKMFNEAKDEMERVIKADMFASDEPLKSSISETPSGTIASTLYDATDDDEEEEEE
jgi:Sec-independent protein translocase protein TatA